MSRSGYYDDWDGDGVPPEFYRSAVRSALTGRRGQAFLRRLAGALDRMPSKDLAAHEWVGEDGSACALGVAAIDYGMRQLFATLDPDDGHGPEIAARLFGIARCMAAEIVYINDEAGRSDETPEARWKRVRAWVEDQLQTGNNGET